MILRYIKLLICPLIFTTFFSQPVLAQTGDKWDLRKCVEYALKNNISVKQADLQIRFAELDAKQSKLSQYPNASYNTNLGYSSGRNQDPTNFSLITTGYLYSNHSLQAGVDIFNWFSKKYTVEARQLTVEAKKAGFEKAQNDVALNVAIAYLQALLANEQIKVAGIQVEQTKSQLESTEKQVQQGNLPEINASQLEAQLAADSATLITAETSARQSVLQLKALLNLDAAAAFEIDTPPVELIPVENIADLQPEAVYNLATVNMPQQKVDILNVQSAQKSVFAARGEMYPTLSLFGSLGASFNNKSKQAISKTQVNPPIGKVTISGTDYNVYPSQPYDVFTYGNISYFDQLNQNFRQSIGVSLSVPIFNGGNLRSAWQRSKLNLQQAELTKAQNSQTLKQDIYTAYNDALAALQKFNANKKAVETAQKTYDFATKRFEVGLLSTYDLITSQNNLTRAKYDMLSSQYDFVFKIKLLEFYKGQGLKL